MLFLYFELPCSILVHLANYMYQIIKHHKPKTMKSLLFIFTMLWLAFVSIAQSAESLKERIQEHYKAIHSDNREQVLAHHLDEFSIFRWYGGALLESGFQETAEKMGAEGPRPKTNVIMKHFNAQIYDNVGLATFYLEGKHGEVSGLWRVSALWVWEDGNWKEAHHHESRLMN